MNHHLSAQSKPDPRGGLYCFWSPNNTWTATIGILGMVKIIKNWLRKLWPPNVEGAKNSKTEITKYYKA